MHEILVIVIYKGGGGLETCPPGKFFKLTCHLLHFQRRLMCFCGCKISQKYQMKHLLHQRRDNYVFFFLSKKPLFFLLVHTQQHDMRKQKNYLRPINFFFLSAETNRSCNQCYSNFAALPYTLHKNSCTFRVSVLDTLSRACPTYT